MVVWDCFLRVLPVVGLPVAGVVYVSWVGEVVKVFCGGWFAFVGVAPRWWHVGVWLAVLLINEVLNRVVGENFRVPWGIFGSVLWLAASR